MEKWQIELLYGYEDGECGIYHAFLAEDPDSSIDTDAPAKLAEMLDTTSDSQNFNWDSMYINLPDSVVEKIKAAGVREYIERTTRKEEAR